MQKNNLPQFETTPVTKGSYNTGNPDVSSGSQYFTGGEVKRFVQQRVKAN